MKLVKVLIVIFAILSVVIAKKLESSSKISASTKESNKKTKENSAVQENSKESSKTKVNSALKEKSKTEKQIISNKSNTFSKRVTSDLKNKKPSARKVPGEETVFAEGVEAEEVKDLSLLPGPPGTVKDSPIKNIRNKSDVPVKSDNPLDYVSKEITGQGVFGEKPPHKIELLPVEYVKEISPTGKASLELAESGDFEYQRLLNAGFETPKVITQVVGETPTRVDRAATQEFNWKPIDPREGQGFWQNVEFNKYQNRLLDTHRYFTPAKFEKNMFGNIVVHAPSDSAMQITTQARSVLQSDNTAELNQTRSFVSLDDEERLVDDLNALDTSEIVGLEI